MELDFSKHFEEELYYLCLSKFLIILRSTFKYICITGDIQSEEKLFYA